MYARRLTIEGFRNFGKPFEIVLSDGLSVIVGENGSGKSAIVDAMRLILQEDEYGRGGISAADFCRPFAKNSRPADALRICLEFSGLSKREEVVFLPWTDLNGNASLTLSVTNRQNNRGRYHWNMWGGASRSSAFERELFDAINCIYLPPLRDAEARLREGRGSRLARLLKKLSGEDLRKADQDGQGHPLVRQVRDSYESLARDKNQIIYRANDLIRTRLQEALGNVFGQDTTIQFSEASFDRIVESLRVLFFPSVGESDLELYRSLEENSLGYNNLIYLATVLAELLPQRDECLTVLLIEEPEAHLHPQIQVRLLKYIEEACTKQGVQSIVTTHSPVLASAASLGTLIHLSATRKDSPKCIRVDQCGLTSQSESFLARWLDVTKSTLFFAKGIILVEGIAEAMLLPELAKRSLKRYNEAVCKKSPKGPDNSASQSLSELPTCLADAGVSVINMGGVYFKHFMQLFCRLDGSDGPSIGVRCAGITDRDPPSDSAPNLSDEFNGQNPMLELVDVINRSKWARLYPSAWKTLEYDLAMEADNLKCMLDVLLELWPSATGSVRDELTHLTARDWRHMPSDVKAQAASELLKRVKDPRIGKGLFAQALAGRLGNFSLEFAVPRYVQSAVVWSCGGDPSVI